MKLDLKSKKGKLILFGSIATVAVVATAVAVPVALLVPGKSSPASSSTLSPENTGLSAAVLQEIATFNKNNNDALLVVPSAGWSRVTVKDNAFSNRTDLPDGFTLPSAVTDIAANAFKGAKLPLGFTIPAGVTSLDPTAFADVVFDEANYWDESEAKAGAKVDVVENNKEWKAFVQTYPGSLEGKATKAGAFSNRKDLTTGFRLPSFLTRISDDTFWNATLPEGFTLPNAVTDIGRRAFSSVVLPSGFTLPNGVKNLGEFTFRSATLPGGFRIPDTITSLGIPADRTSGTLLTFSYAVVSDDFRLPPGLLEIDSSVFLNVTLPLNFSIPATTKIYSYSSQDHSWSTSPELFLDVKLSTGGKWSDSRGAVAGSKVIPVTTT